MICPICGSDKTQKRGQTITKYGKTARFYCHEHRGFFSEADTVLDLFPAVLLLDIETLPIIGYVWDVYDVNIRPEQIIEDWCLLGWSAKWLLDDKMISDILSPREALKRNDKRLVGKIWALLDEADVIIGQNVRRFDLRKLNSRFLKHGIAPPSSYKTVDTLIAARSAFGQTFNKLDSLAKYLGYAGKTETNFKLWADCDAGDTKALEKMRRYNENDVLLLEKVYLKMRAWIPNHPRFTAYEKVKNVCPVCFGPITNIGYYQAAVKKYPEFRCQGDCGAVFHSTRPARD